MAILKDKTVMRVMLWLLVGLPIWAFAQTDPLNQPWLDTNKAIIIDLYAGNEINWKELKNTPQLTAMIHKASQGLVEDVKYNERRTLALKHGYKWGSYHLGTPGDPIQQADYYLKIIGNHPDELMALDLESNDSTKHMNLRNAVIFIKRIHQKTNRYPLIYCNKNMMGYIEQDKANHLLWSLCPLWYARFIKTIADYSTEVWEHYTLWQFSSEINCKKTGECLLNVTGTQFDMDINVFYGTKAELQAKWPF
jgi:GH25 family lysozyme M1 (1,4-beta-N-acetylmuramidase)